MATERVPESHSWTDTFAQAPLEALILTPESIIRRFKKARPTSHESSRGKNNEKGLIEEAIPGKDDDVTITEECTIQHMWREIYHETGDN
jgi:hypothetical protein